MAGSLGQENTARLFRMASLASRPEGRKCSEDQGESAGGPDLSEAVLAYVEQFASLNASMTVYNRLQELYDSIRVMAPKRDWTWLKIAQRNLRSRAKPENDKLDRLRSADTLEDLGLSLIAEVETAAYSWKGRDGSAMTLLQRALASRDGLTIALLVRRPFRLKNFAALESARPWSSKAMRQALRFRRPR
jgi:hypothetical protein